MEGPLLLNFTAEQNNYLLGIQMTVWKCSSHLTRLDLVSLVFGCPSDRFELTIYKNLSIPTDGCQKFELCF